MLSQKFDDIKMANAGEAATRYTVFNLMQMKYYLNRCLASVVSDHEVHSNVLTVHVFINPVSDGRRHHVGE